MFLLFWEEGGIIITFLWDLISDVYDVQSRIVASAELRHGLLEPPAQGTKPAGGPHEDVCQATYTQSDITGAAHYN